MWNRLDFICGICKRGWTEPFENERQSLSCAPCGHVFHTRCIQKFMRTEEFCRNCGKPLDKALFNITQVIRPLEDEARVKHSSYDSPEDQKENRNALNSIKRIMFTWGFFVLVLILGIMWWYAENVDEEAESDEISLDEDEDIADSFEYLIELDRIVLD